MEIPVSKAVKDASPHELVEAYAAHLNRSGQDLIRAVPDAHKKFLSELVWVHEEDDVPIDSPEGRISCKLMAVHAELQKTKPVDEPQNLLRARVHKDTKGGST